MVNRAKLNYVIDVGLGVSFFLVFITGLVKFPGLVQFFGISRGSLPSLQSSTLHDWSGVVMGLLVLIHLILHWKWIVCMTKSIFSKEKKCES